MEEKGYNVGIGYMGLIDGEYRLFSCEADYHEYFEDLQKDKLKLDNTTGA